MSHLITFCKISDLIEIHANFIIPGIQFLHWGPQHTKTFVPLDTESTRTLLHLGHSLSVILWKRMNFVGRIDSLSSGRQICSRYVSQNMIYLNSIICDIISYTMFESKVSLQETSNSKLKVLALEVTPSDSSRPKDSLELESYIPIFQMYTMLADYNPQIVFKHPQNNVL